MRRSRRARTGGGYSDEPDDERSSRKRKRSPQSEHTAVDSAESTKLAVAASSFAHAGAYQTMRRSLTRNHNFDPNAMMRLEYARLGPAALFEQTRADKIGNGQNGNVYRMTLSFPSLHKRSRWRDPTRIFVLKESRADRETPDSLGQEMIRNLIAWKFRAYNSLFDVQPILFADRDFVLFGDDPLTNDLAEQCCAHATGHFVQTILPGITLGRLMRQHRADSTQIQDVLWYLAWYLSTVLRDFEHIAWHNDLNTGNIMLDTLHNDFEKSFETWRFCSVTHRGQRFRLPFRVYIIDYGRMHFFPNDRVPETALYTSLSDDDHIRDWSIAFREYVWHDAIVEMYDLEDRFAHTDGNRAAICAEWKQLLADEYSNSDTWFQHTASNDIHIRHEPL